MSHLLTAVGRLHDGQLAAATKVQDVLVNATRKVASLTEKTEVPDSVVRPLRKVTVPLSLAVGTRGEIADFLNKSSREWAELRLTYQAAILEALTGAKPSEGAVPMRPKAAKVAKA